MIDLEYCAICRCLVPLGEHTSYACNLLNILRGDMYKKDQQESEITLHHVLRILQYLEETMKEHETVTCFTCSDLVAQDSLQRCAEYQHMREIKWKWGKRYDDRNG
jgi:hypothetical protein